MEGDNGVEESDGENAIGPLHVRGTRSIAHSRLGCATCPNVQVDLFPILTPTRVTTPPLLVPH